MKTLFKKLIPRELSTYILMQTHDAHCSVQVKTQWQCIQKNNMDQHQEAKSDTVLCS